MWLYHSKMLVKVIEVLSKMRGVQIYYNNYLFYKNSSNCTKFVRIGVDKENLMLSYDIFFVPDVPGIRSLLKRSKFGDIIVRRLGLYGINYRLYNSTIIILS